MGHKRLKFIFLLLMSGFVVGLNTDCAVYPISASDDDTWAPVRDILLAKYTWECVTVRNSNLWMRQNALKEFLQKYI